MRRAHGGFLFITWVTHSSRVSERMEKYNILAGDAITLSLADEIEITKYMAETVEKYKMKVLAYNICRDHVHVLLACEETDRDRIVQILKSLSARRYDLWKQNNKNHQDKGASSLVVEEKRNRGTVQNHLWAQKYNWRIVTSDEELSTLYDYVQNNRTKHELPESNDLKSIISTMLTSPEEVLG